MTLGSIIGDTPAPLAIVPAPSSRYRERRFSGAQRMERLLCRSCKGSAVLLVDVNPGPRSHRSVRVRYFCCKKCGQVEIVELGMQ